LFRIIGDNGRPQRVMLTVQGGGATDPLQRSRGLCWGSRVPNPRLPIADLESRWPSRFSWATIPYYPHG